MNNKGHFHAMFIECLDSASSFCDPTTHSNPFSSSSPSSSPLSTPALDNEIVIPSVVNLCVTSSIPNFDLCDDLYIPHPLKFPLAYASVDFKYTSMISMVSLFNALLDSGCTHHIVCDRHLFRSYLEKSISVGTANCGSLEALGTGDVKFWYPFGDHTVIFILHGCLHTPGAPINLLSVGALVEWGMSCLFSPGGITKVFYPCSHSKLPGFTFSATVSNHLSFLKLDFIAPSVSDLPVALPAQVQDPPASSFPHLKQDSMLWH